MDLILWRHAEARDAREGQDDLERPLTAKGERQARRVAQWLGRQLPAGTQILVSPARRTQQTAAALERKFKTVQALAPGGSVEGLLTAAQWPDARAPVLVVGHQPTLGMVVSTLLSAPAPGWPMRKGAVVWLRTRQEGAQQRVVMHAAVAPELL